MSLNKRGFALPSLLALLPLLIGSLFAAHFFVAQIHLDLLLKQRCRDNGIQTQKKVRPLLVQLIKLNSSATSLKIKHQAAKTAVVACLGSPCLPHALKVEMKLRQARQKLDLLQRTLIAQSNIVLQTSFFATQSQLQNVFFKNRLLFLNQNNFLLRGRAPKLGVVPESSDIAPNYRTTDNFFYTQAFAFNWQYHTEMSSVRSLTDGLSFQFEGTCAVSLKKEMTQWSVVTAEGKFTSKSL